MDNGQAIKSFQVGGHSVFRHAEVGRRRDTDTIAFSTTYDSAPEITFIPQKARSFLTGFSDSDQRMDMVAENKSVSGFDLRAKVIVSSSTTPIDDGFGEDRGDGTAPGRTLTVDGDVTYANLEDANGSSTTYTVTYDVDTTLMDSDVLVTVHMEVNDGPDSTTWTEVATQAYDAGSTWSDEQLSSQEALGTDYDIRLRITYGPTVPSNTATITAHAEGGSPPGVEYDRVDSATEKSMTKNTDDRVAYLARERAS